MQKEEYLIKNAYCSPANYYLCKQNNKRSLLGRKQRSQVARSFPNRYQFRCVNKVTSLFSDRYIFIIILPGNLCYIVWQSLSQCFMVLFKWQDNRGSMGWQLNTSCAFDCPMLANVMCLRGMECASEINPV